MVASARRISEDRSGTICKTSSKRKRWPPSHPVDGGGSKTKIGDSLADSGYREMAYIAGQAVVDTWVN